MPAPATRCPHDAKTPIDVMSPHDPGSSVDGVHEQLARIKRENAQLYEALRTRTVIGQATGLLMARRDLSPDEAFAELTKMSSYANRKLRDVAATLVAEANTSKDQAITRQIALPDQLRSLPKTSPAEPQHGERGRRDLQTSKDAS
jgi:hypothetical protein